MAKKNKQKKGNASGAAHDLSSDKKPKNALQPEPKIAKRSPFQNQFKGKKFQQGEGASLNEKKDKVNDQKDIANSSEKKKDTVHKNLLSSNEKNKEKVQKDVANAGEKKSEGKTQEGRNRFNEKGKGHMEQKNKEKFGGLIFMCNAKTKPDCFRFMVMGFPEGRKELVSSIKPGIKLFLYDYELRLLYGIYKAASAGGMRLEPTAFNGSFGAQVRFVVERDCSPLPINVFKTAIIKNFEERKHTFKPELSNDQVKRLLNLFRTTPGQPNASAGTLGPLLHVAPRMPTQAILPPPQGSFANVPLIAPMISTQAILPPPQGSFANAHVAPVMPTQAILLPPQGSFVSGPHVPETGRYFPRAAPAKGETAPSKNEDIARESRVRTVKDYQTYGLQPKIQAHTPSSTSAAINHSFVPQSTIPPADSYLGRSNQYHSQHYPVTAPLDAYTAAPKAPYDNNRYHDIHLREELGHGGPIERSRMENERWNSTYDVATAALSDYNRRQQHPNGNPDVSSVPVSSRYSFAGPPLSYR